MDFLLFLQGLRNPVFDAFFSAVTQLGDETFFILAGLVFFWCIDKRQGYYILSVGLVGTVLNQFLKLVFRIPRPWYRDNSLSVVGDAKDAAGGYSFPSGHTQTAVGIFGSVARWNKQVWVRAACIIMCLLVGFSRMYLGVHTPADVGVSMLLGLALVVGFYPIISKATESKRTMRILFACMTAFAALFLAYVSFWNFPADINAHNLASGTENAYKMLGCILGLWLTYEIDERFIRFDTKAIWWAQLIKLVLGLIPLLAIKSGLKQPLYTLIGNEYLADGVRYFLMTAFAGCVWPLTFKFFGKLSK